MKKQYIIGAVALAAVVGGYFAYKQFYKKDINKSTDKDIDATKGKPIEDKDLPKEFWDVFYTVYKDGKTPRDKNILLVNGKKYIFTITSMPPYQEGYWYEGYWSLV
jgi:hypothetical protein